MVCKPTVGDRSSKGFLKPVVNHLLDLIDHLLATAGLDGSGMELMEWRAVFLEWPDQFRHRDIPAIFIIVTFVLSELKLRIQASTFKYNRILVEEIMVLTCLQMKIFGCVSLWALKS